MGFFKKIFRGVKKVFKKIGRGIKKGFQKFGKFMNKIGIVGQIAMMFILPMVGNALVAGMSSMLGLQGGTGLSTLAGTAATATTAGTGLLGSTSALLRAAGAVVKGAGAFAKIPGNIFNSVTKGIENFAKWGLNKVGVNVAGAPTTLFGKEGVFGKFGQDLSNAFDPVKALRGKPIMGEGRTLADISKTSGISVEDLGKANVDITKGVKLENWGDIVATEGTSLTTRLPTLPAGAAPSTGLPPSVEGTSYEAYMNQFEGVVPETTVPVEGTSYEAYKAQFEGETFIPETSVPVEDSLLTKPKPEVTIPDLTEGLQAEKSFVERTWDATKRQYFSDPITGIKTVKRGVDWYSGRQQDDPTVRYGGGVLPGIGYFGQGAFEEEGSVTVPMLQNIQRQGLFGWSAHLDEQLTWRQQLNKNLSLGLGGGT